MQRLSLMRIMKRQRMKYEDFFIMRITNGSTANGRAENKRRSFHLA